MKFCCPECGRKVTDDDGWILPVWTYKKKEHRCYKCGGPVPFAVFEDIDIPASGVGKTGVERRDC